MNKTLPPLSFGVQRFAVVLVLSSSTAFSSASHPARIFEKTLSGHGPSGT